MYNDSSKPEKSSLKYAVMYEERETRKGDGGSSSSEEIACRNLELLILLHQFHFIP